MAVLSPPAVRPGTPSPAITRSAAHQYTYRGVTYPGVTGILKVLDKSDALMAWASRNTAEAALAQLKNLDGLRETVGDEGVIKALTSRAGWKRDAAAALGTRVHALADDLVARGIQHPELPDEIAVRVMQYAAWWQQSGWSLRISEAYLVNPEAGYGGTLDLLARDREGRTVLADLKTGKGVYRETRLQLAAYGDAKYIAPPDSPTAYAMPKVDRYVVLQVTETQVREIEVAIDEQDRWAFLNALGLHQWTQQRGGRLAG